MTDFSWRYLADVDRVVDGDTIDLTIDQGFRNYTKQRVRLANVDTAEIYGVEQGTDEHELGMTQTRFVQSFVHGADQIVFESYGEAGKYGRWIGDISVDENSLVDALISEWPEVETDYE